MSEIKKIKVSDEFVSIFRNFNVIDQVENIKKLSQKERYLLFILSLDKFDPEDPVVRFNFQPFKDEVMGIYDVQDDKEVEDETLKELIKETGDRYIDTDTIVTSDGKELPEIYTKEEVRDQKIKIINSEEGNK